MKDSKTSTRQTRMQAANALICVIAGSGRRFFADGGVGHISFFELRNGRPWFVDGHTGKAIYVQHQGRWRGFSGGGTLRELINKLRVFIMHDYRVSRMTFGPWPQYVCNGDLWGYGSDMERVRDAAAILGVTRPKLTEKDPPDQKELIDG